MKKIITSGANKAILLVLFICMQVSAFAADAALRATDAVSQVRPETPDHADCESH